jgi:hypothetical protein
METANLCKRARASSGGDQVIAATGVRLASDDRLAAEVPAIDSRIGSPQIVWRATIDFLQGCSDSGDDDG